jgi:hypothetical protein
MAKRDTSSKTAKRGRVRRVAAQVSNSITRVFRRREESPQVEPPTPVAARPPAPTARPVKRESDFPLDLQMYTPHQTNMKTGFRDDGRNRQIDQEFALGVADDGFLDEDVFHEQVR